MRRLVIPMLAVSLWTMAASGMQQSSSDPLMGVRNLNVSKSKLTGPAVKSIKLTYAPDGAGLKASLEIVDGQGRKITEGYTAKFDGKEYAYSGSPDVDRIAITRPDPRTMIIKQTKAGKFVWGARLSLSQDGKTATLTETSPDGSIKRGGQILVYEK